MKKDSSKDLDTMFTFLAEDRHDASHNAAIVDSVRPSPLNVTYQMQSSNHPHYSCPLPQLSVLPSLGDSCWLQINKELDTMFASSSIKEPGKRTLRRKKRVEKKMIFEMQEDMVRIEYGESFHLHLIYLL